MMRPNLLSILVITFLTISVCWAEPVTVENFVRAESDRYFQSYVDKGGFGKLIHRREPTPVDDQSVIRMNRDTLYSVGVFDLTSPVVISKADTGHRYQSMQIISQDHYTKLLVYDPGEYTVSREMVGTRYAVVLFRTLVDTSQPEDTKIVNEIQDKITISQKTSGDFEVPDWNRESMQRIRAAVNVLGASVSSNQGMFGDSDDVNPIDHLIGTAYGWGGLPRREAVYVNVVPELNDGDVPYALTVGEVPVDGFWSISLYNGSGFFEKNEWSAYTIDDRSAVRDKHGSVTIHFGGDPAQPNYLKIMHGWNYVVRLYRPRPEILDGSWVFPTARPETDNP